MSKYVGMSDGKIFALLFVTTLMYAQNGTVPLSPVAPYVVRNESQTNLNLTVATTPGSVTFTTGSATYTLSLQGPASVAGATVGDYFMLTSPVNFTLSHSMSGFNGVTTSLEESSCLLFTGPAFTNSTPNSVTCAINQLHEVIINGTAHSGFELVANVHLDTGTASAAYDVHFQWSTTPASCPAASSEVPAPRDKTCTDSISLGPVFPAADTTILIPAAGQPDTTRSPEFVGPVMYQLQSTAAGVVSLELRNQDMKLIGVSTGINVGKGSGPVGFKAPYLIITPFTFSTGGIDDSNTTELVLRAILSDASTGQVLAMSVPVIYPAEAAKVSIQLLKGVPGEGTTSFTVADPAQIALNADGFADTSSAREALQLRVTYQLPQDLKANLSVRVMMSADGKFLALRSAALTESPVTGNNTKDYNVPAVVVRAESDLAQFQVAMTLTNTGQTVLSNPLQIAVNEITIVEINPDPVAGPALPTGVTQSSKADLSAITHDSGRHLRHVVDASLPLNDYTSGADVKAGSLTPLKRLDLTDDFSVDIPGNAERVGIYYEIVDATNSNLSSARSRYLVYKNFQGVIGSLLAKTIPIVQGQITNVQSKVNKAIDDYTFATNLLNNEAALNAACASAKLFKVSPQVKAFLQRVCPPGTFNGKALVEHALRPRDGNPTAPDLITIHTWVFDPPVPNDGSFAGDITFDYAAGLLPDDPNFDESKLQIISIDNTTGNATVIPAMIDTVNKTATAHITQIAPVYALGVVGPFSNSSQVFSDAGAASTISLVNFGSASAPVTLRGYDALGATATDTPPSIAVPASQQYLSTFSKALPASAGNLGWVRADAANTQIVGAEILTNALYFDVLPAAPQPSAGPWIVTAAELSDTSDTQIRITNPGTQTANINIYLENADGSDAGTYSGLLDPKQQMNGNLTAFFPSLATTFQGYAIVWGDEPITVAEYLTGPSTLAAMNAQIPSLTQSSTLYASRLGAAHGVTTLTLVNPTTANASITVSGFGPNGAPVGKPATFSLAAGQQYRNALSTVLGIDDTQTGTLAVTSDQPGLVGHLDLTDVLGKAFRATLPLDTSPSKTLAIPYVAQNANATATISVSNVSGSPANVTIKAFNSDGSTAGTKSVMLAANGQAADTLANLIPAAASLATGFVTVSADQPVTGAALLTSGAESGLLPAQPVPLPAPRPGNPGNGPLISPGGVVNGASFQGPVVRGGLATIFGSNFTAGASGQASSLPLPLSLAGVSVTVAGIPAPLIFVVGNQINFQVPFEVTPGTSAPVIVTANGVASASVLVSVVDYAPAVFTYARTATALDPIVVHGTTNQLVTPSNPAQPNEILVVFGTGVGKLNNAPHTGSASPSQPVATSVDVPQVTLGGAPVQALFTGLTPGFIGLVQFNIQLPATLPAGNSLPLVIAFPSSAASMPVNLSVSGDGGGSGPGPGPGPGPGGNGANILRTLAYNEITRFAKEVRFANGGMPVLSGSGNRIVYANAPGDETDARYNDIFVVNADGSGQRQGDSYKQNCYCGAVVDISADGNTVISTDSTELRIASATGSTGRRLVTNREIPYARIAPKGDKVFFINRRGDASTSDPTTERGLYVINADGSGLRQVAGPKAVASVLGVSADQVFPFATNGWSLDVSADGTKLVFGVATPAGERILGVNADGTGLKQVLGPVNFVNHAALSGDGSKVAYDIVPPPCCSSPNEIGVVNSDGSNRKILATNTPDPGSGNRVELNTDGSQLLFGNTSYLYATDGSGVVQLGVRGNFFSSDKPPLVGDGLYLPSMNSSASRFAYISSDDAGIRQLATMDVNPAALGDAPAISSPKLSQSVIGLNGANPSLVTSMVSTPNQITRVSAAVLNAGITDPNVTGPVMVDDGTSGDQVAGDGIYSGRISANCCAVLGPKTVRVKAEVRDSGNRRHATAIEFGGLTVAANAP